jgi:CBS domain-containing protein
MNVARLLGQKGATVATIAPGAPVTEALALLAERGIGALVVSSDGAGVEGILSERDVVRALHARGRDVLDGPVAALMSREVTTAEPSDTTAALMGVMTEQRIRHLPVVADGRLVGIVSIGDVVKVHVTELEDDKRALHEYITAR